MAKPAPTAEQQKIVEAAQKRIDLCIEAGAGTGKTSTLALIAEALPEDQFLYIAYNKAIQVEASAKFPSNVECRTAHSLAYRSHGAPMRKKLSGQRTYAKLAASILGIRPFSTKVDDEDLEISPRQIAVAVREAIGNFCNSDDDRPSYRHIPVPNSLGEDYDKHSAWRQHVAPYVDAAWADIINPKGQLTQPYFSHDCYLKMWALTKPQLHKTILFDEAQDANPCIAGVVAGQNMHKILVGDRAQAIYGWRGAIDAMQNFAGERLFLTQSFRFGSAVAEQANRWLTQVDTPLRITGFDKIDSKVEALDTPDCILCRTNAGVIESAMNMQAAGLRVAITGGTAQIESFAKAANNLMQGLATDHPELGIYRTWSEVQDAVKNGEASDLGAMVRIIDNYGVGAVLDVCRNSAKIDGEPSEWAAQPGNVMVSTAHKAKGLEWDAVRIHSDFQPNKETGKLSVPEAMLIYVAVTRAKKTLDNTALAWLDKLEQEINETMDDEDQAFA